MTQRIAVVAVFLLTTWTFAAQDPTGDAADPARDIVSYSISGEANQAVIHLEVKADWNFDAVQVLLDTQPGSGFAIAGGGADLMVETTTVYRYAGKGEDWTWQPIGEAKRQVAGRKLTLHIPRELIGADHAKVLIRTLTSDWQTAVDLAPDQGMAELRFQDAGAASQPSDREPARTIKTFTAEQQGPEVVFKVTAGADNDFGTYLLFLDTDLKSDTGFQPPADPSCGFELLITGDRLMKHAGATRNAWQWEPIGAVQRSVDGNTLTLRAKASDLGTSRAGATVWAMSRDWQTLVDRQPRNGLKEIAIQAQAVAPRPPTPFAKPRADRDQPARQRVAQAKNFYCYYGGSKVAELSHYDLVILHSPEMSAEHVRQLGRLGVVTIGYLTVGEDEPPKPRQGDGTGPGGYAGWYFDKNQDGQPDMNPIWFSYYANANDPKWRADRVAEATRLVREEGFDGIFLDTLDTAVSFPESRPGMVQLVRDLRAALPEAPIILNQGFSMLAELAPLADGLMLESFTATYDFDSKSYMMNYPQSIDYHLQRVRKDIQPVLQQHPLKVLVLDYAPEDEIQRIQEAANRAATFGFLFAAAPIHLDDVYTTQITGKPDPKWLEKITTPRLLSLTLKEPANGFPAGTMLMPSSAFAGYTVAPLVDGITDRAGLHWSKAAWASSEDGEAAWLEMRLPDSRGGGTLQVDFEPSHPSRQFRVSVRAQDDAPWQTVRQFTDNTQRSVRIELPEAPYRTIRLDQPADGGSTDRPNLLWLAQLRLQPPQDTPSAPSTME